MNNTSRRTSVIRYTGIAAALAAAMTVAGGGYALASSHSTAPASRQSTGRTASGGDALRYIVGGNVAVPADSTGSNATKCPRGMYPVGGGPSSSLAVWETQWSDPDRSAPSAAHPNEWTVSLFNNSSSTADFKVFVVCSTASSVTGNY